MDELKVGLLVLCASVASGVVGYLMRRYLEGSGAAEKLGRMHLALEIKQKMDEGNFTPKEVERLVRELIPRWPWQRRKEHADEDGGESYETAKARARSSVLTELAAGDPPNFGDGPQLTMNLHQSERLERATGIMKRVLKDLEGKVSEDTDHLKKLASSQRAWEKYRDAQAVFASLTFEGGSMQPLVRDGAATQLTIDRVVELRMEIFERGGYDAWNN